MDKRTWKWLMYSKPSWYFFGKYGGSREAQEAAEEYEEEVLPAIGCLGLILIIGLVAFGILKFFGAV